MRRLAVIIALVGVVFMAAPAGAHRVHAGVTEIAVNPRTEELEIMHRVFAHDLVVALGHEELDVDAVFGSEEGLAQIGAYVSNGFRLANTEGRLFNLNYVGAELDGEFGWIYFTAEVPADQSSFIVDNDIMVDEFEDQVMMTNFRINSLVRTAMQGPGRRDPVHVRFER